MTNTDFTLIEATVAEIHEAFRSGALTSEALVERYIDRIEAYDRAGPELNGVVTVNPNAASRAAELDDAFDEDGPVGPLHGIPLLVKDQVSTAGLVTTYGSAAFADYVPDEDATIVDRLRDAGGIVLAKTNLPDFAAGFAGFSSVLGQTRNPYAPAHDAGGSSAGTGSGVAANLGTIGIGEDTGGSIRVPASCCNLFGLRVTTGLVSRTGLSPLVDRMDTPGPMARTVEDLARLLDALVGFDPDDERTAATRFAAAGYAEGLDDASLSGARIGVFRQRFGDGPTAQPVNRTVEDALAAMSEAGAELIDPVTVPDLDRLIAESALHDIKPKHDIDAFLADLADPPVDAVEELYRTGAYHEDLALFDTIADAPADPTGHPDYWQRVAGQEALREALLYCLEAADLDAFAFPDVQVPPPRCADRHSGAVTRADYTVNTIIASQSACPALSVPAGFTDDGLPVGLELLGAPYDEPRLLELAAAYEAATAPRRPPAAAPAREVTTDE